MSIQSYNIDFIKELANTIKSGIADDIKESLLHIKSKNGFNIYSSNQLVTTLPKNQLQNQPQTPNQPQNQTTEQSTNIFNSYNNEVNNPNNLNNRDISSVLTEKETSTWRNDTNLKIRKPINPNENNNKKELFLLLNKISESNFQIILKQIISLVKECESDGESVFTTLIDRLFRSAMIQVNFCHIYAKICVDLLYELDSKEVNEAINERISIQLNSLKDFSSSMELSDYESFCNDVAFKNKYIGCYQFITELLNNKCLSFNKLIDVLNDLDINIGKQENSIKIDILVESICKIYQSVNRTLLNKIQVEEMNLLIKEILSKYKQKMSSRAKYIFEDVLESIN